MNEPEVVAAFFSEAVFDKNRKVTRDNAEKEDKLWLS
jgi:hypothetical protein